MKRKKILFVCCERIKRELNKRLIFKCRCDERLKGKTKDFFVYYESRTYRGSES